MAHTLIVGVTGSGKTYLAHRIAANYLKDKVAVLVLDPTVDKASQTAWPVTRKILPGRARCVVVTTEAAFFRCYKDARNCAVFIDECGELIGQDRSGLLSVFTRGRNYGIHGYGITQRATQISPTLRANCEELFMFQQHASDAKIIAQDRSDERLLEATKLKRGYYFYKKNNFTPATQHPPIK